MLLDPKEGLEIFRVWISISMEDSFLGFVELIINNSLTRLLLGGFGTKSYLLKLGIGNSF